MGRMTSVNRANVSSTAKAMVRGVRRSLGGGSCPFIEAQCQSTKAITVEPALTVISMRRNCRVARQVSIPAARIPAHQAQDGPKGEVDNRQKGKGRRDFGPEAPIPGIVADHDMLHEGRPAQIRRQDRRRTNRARGSWRASSAKSKWRRGTTGACRAR